MFLAGRERERRDNVLLSKMKFSLFTNSWMRLRPEEENWLVPSEAETLKYAKNEL